MRVQFPRMALITLFLAASSVGAGCGKDTGGDETADTTVGACGKLTEHDVDIEGKVQDGSGISVVGADVWLEDRGWEPITVLGQDTSASLGLFRVEAKGVTSLPNCWGTVLDYVLVASDGTRTGEVGINLQLHAAIFDGSNDVDLTAFPIVIE